VLVVTGLLAGVPAAVETLPSEAAASPQSLGESTVPATTPVVAATGAVDDAPPPAEAAAADAVIPPPPVSFDAAPAAAIEPPPLLRMASDADAVDPAGGTWAVVIGIDDYPGSRSDLRASVLDADTVEHALAGYGVTADRRLVLRNTQATAAVIRESLHWLVTHAGPDAAAVFFYAGHVRQLGAGTEAIVAADGQMVTDREVADGLRPLAAHTAWIAMASCFGGGFDEVLAPGRILTAAAGAGSLAYENASYGNSYLVEYMVERAMLKGSAPETVERSFAWARAELARDHPSRVPVQVDQFDGELRLGAPRGDTPPPEPPSPSPSPRPSPPPPSPTTTTTEPKRDEDCLLNLGSLAGCG
jgi:hypothetical protein